MTIGTETNRNSYLGDAVTTTFAYTFKVFDATEVQVWLDGVLTSTGYSVTDVGEPSGNVVFETPPGSGVVVVLRGDPDLTQEYDYEPYDPFPADDHERNLDIASRGRISLQDAALRTVRGPVHEVEMDELPPAAQRANGTLVFDSEGQPAVGTGELPSVPVPSYAEDLLIQPDAESARAYLGVPNPNLLINGNFNVWQNGVNFTLPALGYTADMWFGSTDTVMGRSVNVPPDVGAAFSLDAQRTSGGSTFVYYGGVEFDTPGDAAPLVLNRDYTLSLWVLTTVSTEVGLTFYFANVAGLSADRVTTATATITGITPGVWQKVSATVQFASAPNANNTHMYFRLGFGVDELVRVAQAKLEVGDTATPFEPELYDVELRRCQRYFLSSFPKDVTPAQNAGANGSIQDAARSDGGFLMNVRHKFYGPPTVTLFNTNQANDEVYNLNDATSTPGNATNIGDTGFVIVQQSKDATDANDRMRVHFTAAARL